jgi:hypothetical protein
MERKYIDA